MKSRFLLVFGLAGIVLPAAQAAVSVTSWKDVAPSGSAGNSYDPASSNVLFTPSSTDLAQGLTAAVAYESTTNPGDVGDVFYESAAGPSVWTDGSISTVYATSGMDAANHASYGVITGYTGSYVLQTFVTFDLGSVYDLSQIDVYTGWNDSGRDDSSFTILVSSDGLTFDLLGSYAKGSDDTGTYTSPVTNLHSFTDDGGAALATGVQYVQLQFTDADNARAGLVEVDVFAAVPEPATVGLAGLGLLAGVSRRRRTAC
ncbi:hypothetical protein HNR46_003447 [Haloferula luteola]|uniref:Ice-binding protein C-terminal domain-containing protein n=1 Tax=Haloferula luteola TaxID=595692 RepID=A0A840V6C1_9BACT|nr:PEP-CTERM sorting domain-containing protein [Haloferula luteola]MBB5353193.1 hypothetical protein [Haloferula luteola]